MRFPSKLLSAFTAIVILSGLSASSAASAASVSDPVLHDTVSAYVYEKSSDEIRSYFKKRVNEFSIVLPDNIKITQEVEQLLLFDAFEETGAGDEGDYLRFAVKNYSVKQNSQKRQELLFSMQYYTTAEQEKELTEKVKKILGELSLDGQPAPEKIRRIYDYITRNVSYSKNFNDPLIFSAYGAAIKGSAVCQGITQLMYRLLMESGVDARIIAGVSVKPGMSVYDAINSGEQNHVWMMAKTGNLYYLCDPTWDINLGKGSSLFLMKGKKDFDEYSSSYHYAYNNNGLVFPEYDSDEFKTAYPVADTAYKMPVYKWGDVNGDGYIDAVDASMILAEYARVSSGGNSILSTNQKSCADVNTDGFIDAVDASAVLAKYADLSAG